MNLADVLQQCTRVLHLWNGAPTKVELNPPAPDTLLKDADMPEQYRSFLSLSNGGHFYPWRDGGVGGIRLLPLAQLDLAQDAAYLLDESGKCERRFFVIGEFCTTGNYLGMAQDGSLWFLDHEYGPEEWYQGQGAYRVADDLTSFLLKLSQEKGRWWFLPNN